jgi:hypothetical protein
VYGGLSVATINLYIAAVCDLWVYQNALGVNSNPQPRGEHYKMVIKSIKSQDLERQRAEFLDRAENTMVDGYTSFEEVKAIGNTFFGSVLRFKHHFVCILHIFLIF